MHLKRQKSPKIWPIERKGTAYIIKSYANNELGVPVIIALRDILKLAQNRKEVKEAISSRKIFIDGNLVNDEKQSVLLFDVLSIPLIKKFYRLVISENGKFHFNEISESESNKKVSKITNKKIIKGKRTQLNLIDGRNFLSEIKCKVNDSVVIDFKKRMIEKCLPMGEKSKVFVFKGKHLGKQGTINNFDEKTRTVEVYDGENKINALIEQIIVIE